MKMNGAFLFLFGILINFSCITKKEKDNNEIAMDTASNYNIPYNLQKPVKKIKLPNKLEEISGIAFYQGNDVIACHNDEQGKIFLFDLDKEEIIGDFKFDKDGDYEDIEVIGKVAYVIRSDGRLHEIENFASKSSVVKEYKTKLSEKNDVEGLCYNKEDNTLLLACKASPNIGTSKYKDARAIYSFDLQTKKLEKEPYMLIYIDDVRDTNTSAYEEFSEKLAKNFSAAGDPSFQPSAIGIHPITDDIYILSSVGKKIVVCNKEKEIVAIAKMNKKIFPQPEGICFKTNGDMLISNEGKNGKANVLVFKYMRDA